MTDDTICPVCESRISKGTRLCDVCGADLKLLADHQAPKYECPSCGYGLQEADSFCPSCGTQFTDGGDVAFQCPSCSAEVSSAASRCPKCGVEFLSDDEAAAAEDVPKGIRSVPATEVLASPSLSEITEDATVTNADSLIDEVEESLHGIGSTARPPEWGSNGDSAAAAVPETRKGVLGERLNGGRKGGLFRHKSGRGNESTAGSRPGGVGRHHDRDTNPASPASRSLSSTIGDETKLGVEQLRSMLKFAGGTGVDISEGKMYLDASVEFAKSGNREEAARQIKLAQKSVDRSIQSFFKEKINVMRKQSEIESAAGGRRQGLESAISSVSELIRRGAYEKAYDAVEQFRSGLSPTASQYGEAKELIDGVEELLGFADETGIEYDNARMIFTEARKHLATGDWSTALIMAKQSRESLMRTIPDRLLSEMNRAKSEIIDAKVIGVNVTELVSTLKEASNAYSAGRYDMSLRFLNIFRRDLDRAKSLSPDNGA